ncbi:MAG: hypothetical protein AB1324_00310 [Candidatus Micrarchaeota archaeon]
MTKKEERKPETAGRVPDAGKQDAGRQAGEKPGMPAPPEKTAEAQQLSQYMKDIESALFAVKFYPVAVSEQAKNEALGKLEGIYASGGETVRQLMLYMLHEILVTSNELKIMHGTDYFKMKNPQQEPAQLRIGVYRAMFNYNTSLEGLIEVIRLLGRLKGSDDAAKLLTYHFSHLAAAENEANHMLRSAILETLGECESQYALRSLLEYAKFTDSERSFGRIVSALQKWEERVDSLRISDSEKAKIREQLKEIITSDFGGSHYG